VDNYGCTFGVWMYLTVFFSCNMCWIGDEINANVRGLEGSNELCLRNDEGLDGVFFTNLGFCLFSACIFY
jgi:hypothetical protein